MQEGCCKKTGSLLFACIILLQMAAAQTVRTGRLLEYKVVPGGIEGKTSAADFDIHAYSDHIIRVRFYTHTPRDFSYALVNNEVPAFPVKIETSAGKIILRTKAITAEIERSPYLRICFKDSSGNIINEDEENGAVLFSGSKVSTLKKLQPGEHFTGLGEALGNLDKRGMGITLNNTDTYKYGDPRLPMYISIPFYIGIHHQVQYGIFFHNTYKTFFNFGSSTPYTSVTAGGGDADYFFIYDTSVAGILTHYASLTGTMPLPPKWSLGYQQSRCTYYPQSRVEWIASSFRQKQIPLDGIVLDADYQQGYQPFKTNLQRFPDLPALSSKLEAMNIQLTASVYPGVKIDSTYDSYTDGLKKDVFLKYSDGRLFKTEIAPLPVCLPDYTNPDTRSWWVDKMRWMQNNGIAGYWNDMNEPAVAGSYLPDDVSFYFDGKKAGAAEAKNVYGFQMARSSYEAGLLYRKGKRPFVLTRSAFAGVQRYSAVWSGDNTASDEGLLSSVLLNSQMSLSGIPFVGPDLGGYIGDGNKDLFKRWIEVGVFSPYVRNHKEFFATANEPWSYGEEVEMISKSYIGFRYRLMPYIYSKFYEASVTGMPVVRSLCIGYPHDEQVYDNNYQYQFLFGDALLVAPVTSKETSKKLYLPAGDWYNLFTDERLQGNSEILLQTPSWQIPLLVKASSFIPMQSLVQSTKDAPGDTLFIHLYNGSENNRFTYYEDAGDGFDYKKGVYYKRIFSFIPAKHTVQLSAAEGSFIPAFKKIKLMLHGFHQPLQKVQVNGVAYPVGNCSVQLLDGLEYLGDYYDAAFYKSLRAAGPVINEQYIVTDNIHDEINIQLP